MSNDEYFYVITVQKPGPQGLVTFTGVGTAFVDPDGTRAELYAWVRDLLPAGFEHANTMFFHAEPNRLAHATGESTGSAA